MSALKEMFNHEFYRRLARQFKSVYPPFAEEKFIADVTDNLSGRELNERLRHTSVTLQNHLPQQYTSALEILKEVATKLDRGYTALVLPDFVGLYGRGDFHESLNALKYFTQFGSSEFAVREFLRLDLHRTLKYMEEWARDENYHVRRLASEGSRPRLPWSFRLPEIVKNPSLTRKILTELRADAELYVRKSVANHLNDISKDSPRYVLELAGSWELDNPHTQWIVKHACRTLIKKGDAETLKLFSFHKKAKCKVSDFIVKPLRLKLGDTLRWSITIKNSDAVAHHYAIDYAITYAREGIKTSRKVFKWKEIHLEKNKSITINKTQVIRDFSTRKHYKGKHIIEVLVNGNTVASEQFQLSI